METRIANAVVQREIAHLSRPSALFVAAAAEETAPAVEVAERESWATELVGSAVSWIAAAARFANEARSARVVAGAAEPGIAIDVHAFEVAAFEAFRADALPRFEVTLLGVSRALLVETAASRAASGFLVAVREARAVDVVRRAVPRVGAPSVLAHESRRAGDVAGAAVAWVDAGVDALVPADLERLGALDRPRTAGPSTSTFSTTDAPGRADGELAIGRQRTRVLDGFENRRGDSLVDTARLRARGPVGAPTGFTGGAIERFARAVEKEPKDDRLTANETRSDTSAHENGVGRSTERLELDDDLPIDVALGRPNRERRWEREHVLIPLDVVDPKRACPGLDLLLSLVRIDHLRDPRAEAVDLVGHAVVGIHQHDELRGLTGRAPDRSKRDEGQRERRKKARIGTRGGFQEP